MCQTKKAKNVMGKLIGREREIDELNRCYTSDRAEFVIVTGRRRIGKTFLVNSVYADQYAFCYTGGHNLTTTQQLHKFSIALRQYGYKPTAATTAANWFEAFEALQELLQGIASKDGKRKIIFIDEMPWIDAAKSDFVEALEYFWNSWGALQDDVMLIASGSATSWMNDKLVANKGGLHARITKQIVLEPFSLKEVEEYLTCAGAHWNRFQIAQTYMVLGGVPFYLSLLDTSKSFAQNVDELFFSRNASLRLEFGELYHALFSNAQLYVAIVEALARKRKGLTRAEIAENTKIKSSALTQYLNNLEKCGFIECYQQYGKKVRGLTYRLIDFYTLFYFKYIANNRDMDPKWWSNNMLSASVSAWQGFSFELLCLVHLPQIKDALGISGIASSVSQWKNETSQIDLIIDRADRIVNLCEMKFSNAPFEITKAYAERLRNRMADFCVATKCKKGISNTFVTTYGVKQGKHSSIVNNQVLLDDLFN